MEPRQSPQAAEHQCQDHFGHRPAVGPGHVANRHTPRVGHLHIYRVDTDADLLDEPQPGSGLDVGGREGFEDVPDHFSIRKSRVETVVIVRRHGHNIEARFVGQCMQPLSHPRTGRVVVYHPHQHLTRSSTTTT